MFGALGLSASLVGFQAIGVDGGGLRAYRVYVLTTRTGQARSVGHMGLRV